MWNFKTGVALDATLDRDHHHLDRDSPGVPEAASGLRGLEGEHSFGDRDSGLPVRRGQPESGLDEASKQRDHRHVCSMCHMQLRLWMWMWMHLVTHHR